MAAAALGEQSVASILGLTLALGEQCEVGSGLGLLLEAGVRLELLEVTLALEHLRGDQTLDLWGLGVLLAAWTPHYQPTHNTGGSKDFQGGSNALKQHIWVAWLTLGGDLPADDTLADVIILVHTPELADLVGPLGSETEILIGISKPCVHTHQSTSTPPTVDLSTGNVAGATLDDHEVEHGEILVDDATTDRLALALAGPALTVALGA